ncbi:hypothetical protein NHQ30_010240 [Ciborinia camelliae]|nr:hypothetical protein NHQ30_010240 [Ciborinia camelliae]
MATRASNGEVIDAPRIIKATPDELKKTLYDTLNLQAALEALHQDGFVVLKSIVDVNHVDRINSYMSKEADELVKNKAKPFNQGVNCTLISPMTPLVQISYLQRLTILSYLGYKPIWNFVTGNNALPKTHGLRQPVHKDITFNHPQCPFYVIANIPLCPFNVSTGSTEFWLGSHAHTSGADQIPATMESKLANAKLVVDEPTCNVKNNVVDERRRVRPPIQPVCEKGDVMLRDLRTWHAGMPNEGEDYRIMIALGYQAQWYPNHTLRSKLPLSRGNFFMKHGGQPVEVRADLLSDDSDFGRLNDQFNFRPTEGVKTP